MDNDDDVCHECGTVFSSIEDCKDHMKEKHSKQEESDPSSDSPERLDEHQVKSDSEPSKDCSKSARSSTNNKVGTLKNQGFSKAENIGVGLVNTFEGKDLSNGKEGPFSALEVVWAKFSGYPPWPALVLPAEPAEEGKRRGGSKVHVQGCNSKDNFFLLQNLVQNLAQVLGGVLRHD